MDLIGNQVFVTRLRGLDVKIPVCLGCRAVGSEPDLDAWISAARAGDSETYRHMVESCEAKVRVRAFQAPRPAVSVLEDGLGSQRS